MKRQVNALISKSDVHFYPDEMKNLIELTLMMQNGNVDFKISASSENMVNIYNVFNTFSVNELKGKYCRVCVDDNGNAEYIENIIYNLDNVIENEKEKD